VAVYAVHTEYWVVREERAILIFFFPKKHLSHILVFKGGQSPYLFTMSMLTHVLFIKCSALRICKFLRARQREERKELLALSAP
jgi:hypothetical protein